MTRIKFQIFHLVTDKQFEIPRKCLEVAANRCPHRFGRPVVRPMFEVQYNEFRRKLTRKNKFVDDNHGVMIFANNRYMLMSELLDLLKSEHCPTVILSQPKFESSWTKSLLNPDVVSPERDYIFFNIHIGGKFQGFLIIEVFTDINPKIANSFVDIFREDTLTVGHYHTFKEGWFEFGIGSRRMPMRGNNHHPLMSHNRRGIMSYCEEFNVECDPFFIHFVPCKFFDDYRTVLGKVVHGDELLNKIENLEVEFGKTEVDFKIHGCGIVPIGKNYSEDADEEEWEKTINDLFGTKYIPGMGKGDRYSDSDVICPIFPMVTKRRVGEETDVISSTSFSTAPTVKSWTEIQVEPFTLYYREDSSDSLDDSSSQGFFVKKEFNLSYINELSMSLTGDYSVQPSHLDQESRNLISDGVSSIKSGYCPSIGTYMS